MRTYRWVGAYIHHPIVIVVQHAALIAFIAFKVIIRHGGLGCTVLRKMKVGNMSVCGILAFFLNKAMYWPVSNMLRFGHKIPRA